MYQGGNTNRKIGQGDLKMEHRSTNSPQPLILRPVVSVRGRCQSKPSQNETQCARSASGAMGWWSNMMYRILFSSTPTKLAKGDWGRIIDMTPIFMISPDISEIDPEKWKRYAVNNDGIGGVGDEQFWLTGHLTQNCLARGAPTNSVESNSVRIVLCSVHHTRCRMSRMSAASLNEKFRRPILAIVLAL